MVWWYQRYNYSTCSTILLVVLIWWYGTIHHTMVPYHTTIPYHHSRRSFYGKARDSRLGAITRSDFGVKCLHLCCEVGQALDHKRLVPVSLDCSYRRK